MKKTNFLHNWFAGHTRQWLAFALLATPVLGPLASAETLYVTDILRLGLHQASDTSDSPFRTLVSGDSLEILERSTYYARVRTANGDVGWVKASYLTDEVPAQARLAALTAQRDTLTMQLADARSRLDTLNTELADLRAQRDTLAQGAQAIESETMQLRSSNAALIAQVAAHRYSIHAKWVLLAVTAVLAGGFFGGWWWADSRQRARHGGFRI